MHGIQLTFSPIRYIGKMAKKNISLAVESISEVQVEFDIENISEEKGRKTEEIFLGGLKNQYMAAQRQTNLCEINVHTEGEKEKERERERKRDRDAFARSKRKSGS